MQRAGHTFASTMLHSAAGAFQYCSAAPIRLIRSTRAHYASSFKYLSFYQYVHIPKPYELQHRLLRDWSRLTLGRVYLATEGINAQLSLPSVHQAEFERSVRGLFPQLGALRYLAQDEDAFGKLHVRVRERLVADGLPDQPALDLASTGTAVDPADWHAALAGAEGAAAEGTGTGTGTGAGTKTGTGALTVIDCRNQWEHQVGRFVGAHALATDHFAGSWAALDALLQHVPRSQPLLLYCTGGIRCEKAAAFLQQQRGFRDVRRLRGGINAYVDYVRGADLPSRFVGKNVHFDRRVTERVSPHVLSRCHQCAAPADDLTNCPHCNVLHVQCPACRARLGHLCGPLCPPAAAAASATATATATPGAGTSPHGSGTSPAVGSNSRSALLRPRALPPLGARGLAGRAAAPEVPREALEQYCIGATSAPSAAVAALVRWTEAREPAGAHMLAGPLVGTLLQQLVVASRARRVLELGTFTGVSALCMAEALVPGGLVISCERDAALAERAREQLKAAGVADRVHVRTGPAMDSLRQLADEGSAFDLIFLDADKRPLEQYYEFILEKKLLAPHGLLVVDNTLQEGRVLSAGAGDDGRAAAVRRFNERLRTDGRVRAVLLPVRDGVSLISLRPEP